jgi:steroid delta-isomerase-like uncharacterized protein
MKKLLCVISLAVLLCFTFACRNKAEKSELEKFRALVRIEEQNKEVVRKVFTAIDINDFDKLRELASDDFSLNSAGLPEALGLDRAIQVLKVQYASIPDLKHVIEEIIGEGDKVAVKLVQVGTHKAKYPGIPAADKKITMPTMCFLTIANGKVKKFWVIEDFLGFYRQLGMELRPKEVKK